MWSNLLDDKQIEDLFRCEQGTPVADIFDWNKAEMITETIEMEVENPEGEDPEEKKKARRQSGREEFEMDDAEKKKMKHREMMKINVTLEMTEITDEEGPCMENMDTLYSFNIPIAMESNREPVKLCEALGGEMRLMSDDVEFDKLYQLSFSCSSLSLWVPIFRNQGEWVDDKGNKVANVPWGKGEPKSGDCAYYFYGEYFAAPCDYKSCFYCNISSKATFKLRGFCKQIRTTKDVFEVDDEFVLLPKELVEEKPTWIGTKFGTTIEWNSEKSFWELSDPLMGRRFAVASVKRIFPVGLQNWVILPGLFCEGRDGVESIEMVLSQCRPGNYTCNDGTCIEIERKCNFIEDCYDSSDESSCYILSEKHYGLTYHPGMADIGFNEDESIIPATVNVSINLLKISGIKEIGLKYTAKFDLHLDWVDRRLTWKNLLKNKSLNFLSASEISKIWVPHLIFKNTGQELETKADNASILLVEKKTDSMVEAEDLFQTPYYSGSENPLSYARVYALNFFCQFELRNFPFDFQTCQIVLSPMKKEKDFVQLIPSKLIYSGPINMMTYTVIDYKMESFNGSVVATIKLKRMVSRHLLSTYLPSLCILIVAQV